MVHTCGRRVVLIWSCASFVVYRLYVGYVGTLRLLFAHRQQQLQTLTLRSTIMLYTSYCTTLTVQCSITGQQRNQPPRAIRWLPWTSIQQRYDKARQKPKHHTTQQYRQRLKRSRDSLLDAIRTHPPPAQLDALVDALATSTQPCPPQNIGDGPWQVVYTRGPLLWRTLAPPGRLLDPVNEFSQTFDWRRGTVTNRGTLLGGLISLTAEGRYSVLGASLPLRVTARVTSGALRVGSLQVPLPIRGEGEVDLVYVDERVRVFRQANGGLAVQVPRRTLV